MLERCVQLDGTYTPAHELLSKLYEGAGRQRAAATQLHMLAMLHPRSAYHLTRYAHALQLTGRYSKDYT